MPYVEGYGTYPFGEEWLFDAVIRSYAPVCAIADRLTFSVTPGARRPARGRRRLRAAARVLRRVPDRVVRGRRARRRAALPGGLSRGGRALPRGARPARVARRRPPAAVRRPGRRGKGRAARLGGDARRAAPARDRGGPAAADRRRAAVAPAAVRRARGASGCPSARTSPGSSGCSPSSPWATSAPTRARTSRRSRRWRRWRRARRSASRSTGRRCSGCGRSTAIRPTRCTPTSTASRCAARGPGRSAARPTTRRPRPPAPASRGASSSTRWPPASSGSRPSAAAPGLIVFAIDTELLGHWWWEGPVWLEEVLTLAPAQGIDLVTLGEAARRHPAERRAAATLELGRGQGPADLGLARGRRPGLTAARRLELRLLRGLGAGLAGAAAERAARELLAVQASDWAFLDRRGQAGDYPWQRSTDHARSLLEALDPAAGRPRPAGAEPGAGPQPESPARALAGRAQLVDQVSDGPDHAGRPVRVARRSRPRW